MRARRSLGMILDGEDGETAMPHALEGLIIEIEVRYLDFRVFD